MRTKTTGAGWYGKAKTSGEIPPGATVCRSCKGNKYVHLKLQNRGTLEWVEHTLPCEDCDGKGYITEKDRQDYRHRVGLAPHPES